MVDRRIRAFYAARAKAEWNRLFHDEYGRLEFDTTMHFIDKHLTGKELRVLDAGGGPGRYTIELARRGHRVVLLDPVPEVLRFAEQQIRRARVRGRVEEIRTGSIEDLSAFRDGTFDFVLCLTPISHVLEPKKRLRAATELVRVLKPNGVLVVSAIGRLAALVMALENGFRVSGKASARELRDTGDFHAERIFTPFHGFLPSELRTLFEMAGGVSVTEMVGLEGIASTHSKAVNRLTKDRGARKLWLETHYKTCTEPSVIGMAEQILLIARKI